MHMWQFIQCHCSAVFPAMIYLYMCNRPHYSRPTWSWYGIFAHLQLPRKTRSSQLVRWNMNHDGVVKWKHFPCYWPFAREFHWWPVDSPQSPVTRSVAVFFDPRLKKNGWANNRDAGDLRRYWGHYDVTGMTFSIPDNALFVLQQNCSYSIKTINANFYRLVIKSCMSNSWAKTLK